MSQARQLTKVVQEGSLTPASFLVSHSTWRPCQNSVDCPKNAPNRADNSSVMGHSPRTISSIVCGGTPIALAIAVCEIPMGLRYSSARISPGVMEFIMVTRYNAVKFSSMIVNYGNLLRAVIRPSENYAPLVVDPDGMKAGQITPQRLQAISWRDCQVGERYGLVHLDELAKATCSMAAKGRLLSEWNSSSVSRSAKDWITETHR